MNAVNQSLLQYVLDQVAFIQQIPAPTFSEQKRAAYIQQELQRLGLQEVHQDSTGNVFACWPGRERTALVVSAHLDTVFPDTGQPLLTRSPERISGPGVGDNAMGLAALLGLGAWLADARPVYPGDVWLVANVCEEGLGNLAGMKAVANHFGEDVLAYLVLEGLGLGRVCHRGLGVSRFRITVTTAGGHSWADYGTPSAIHELARLVTALNEIVLPRKPRTTMNIGIIQGGTSVNTIAARACCELDLRCEDQNTLGRLVNRIRRMVTGAERPGVEIAFDPIGMRPAGAIRPSHGLVKLALECLADLNVMAELEAGSTDANVPLSLGIPAICVGITHGGGPHTDKEFLETGPVATGLEQLICLVNQVWRLGERD